MENKMWEAELRGDHLEAHKWMKKAERERSKRGKVEKDILKDIFVEKHKSLKEEFEKRSKDVIDSFSREVEKLNKKSIESIEKLKVFLRFRF